MRVGIDGRELKDGLHTGIGRYLIEIIRAASQAGWECLVYGDGSTSLGGTWPGVTLHRLDHRWTPWWDQISLPCRLARDRVSVFLSPYYKGPLMAPCPVVLTIHDLFFIAYLGRRRPVYDMVMTRLARLYAGRAAAIIADSDYSKRTVLSRLGLDAAKVTVIPVSLGKEFQHTPLTDEVRSRYGIAGSYLLYVGAFKPHKNLPRLLHAFAGLSEALRCSYRLVLAGGDPTHRPALQELAGALGLTDRVIFPGRVKDADLPALYSGCALCILPSLEEGFGLPTLEAMACGAPVAAAHRAAIPEVVGDGALLFDPEHVGQITEALTRVLTQPDLAAALRRQGLRRAAEFSSDGSAGRVLALLRNVGMNGRAHA